MKTILSSETMDIPNGVKIKVKAKMIEVEGPRGKLTCNFKHLNLDFHLITDEETGQKKLKVDAWFGSHKTTAAIRSLPPSLPLSINSSDENPRKLDSPELRPLPLLSAGLHQNPAGDDEDEEFYSPRGSVGGRESSIDVNCTSRRVFAAIEAKNFEGICGSSSSSSTSDSPARSVSLSISPPVSLSPISSRTKLPKLAAIPIAPPSNSSSPR